MTFFDTTAQKKITKWNDTLTQPVRIYLDTADHPQTEAFRRLADELQASAPQLTIAETESDDPIPGFRLSDGLIFNALPLERELIPFLNALSLLSDPAPALAGKTMESLSGLDMPVRLKLYIAVACPHCPLMVATLVPIALNAPQVFTRIIDGSLFTDQAQKDRVMAAPTLILDDDFSWTGNVSADEIINRICSRDPSDLSPESLKTILEKGDASWITQKMIAKNTLFQSFIALLLNDQWSVRLGAIVVVEELAEENPGLARQLCPPLIEAFGKADTPVQGDILYCLGEAGTPETADWINEKLPGLTHPDLVEAAKDAVESIGDRHDT